VIVCADSSKIDRDVLVLFLRLDQVQMLVTDAGVSSEHREALEEHGIRVLIAEQEHRAN
jgi:DeoR/GlpR family transcriptional regulator of sugar metabolism